MNEKFGTKWRDSEIDFLWKTRKEKDCNKLAVEKLGRTENAVASIKYDLGIKYTPEEMLEDSKMELIRMYEEFGRVPFADEFDKNRRCGKSRRNISTSTGLTWRQFCEEVIGDSNKPFEYDVKKITEIVTSEYNKNGIAPTFKEFKKMYKGASYWQFKDNVGVSYFRFVEQMNMQGNRSTTKIWKDDEMLEVLLLKYNEIGRIPTHDEVNEDKRLPSSEYYNKRFDGRANALNMMGIDFSDMKLTNWGTILYDLNGEMCRSIGEYDISNFLINRDVDYEKEVGYNKILNRESDNRRCDWVIYKNSKAYIVEYFGMYNSKKKQTKRIKNYLYKARKKINDLYKHGLIDECIFIFPWDLKNRNLEDIFSMILKEEKND